MSESLTAPDLFPQDPDGYTFDPVDERHGHRSSYINYRCRCPSCTQANNLYMEMYRDRI